MRYVVIVLMDCSVLENQLARVDRPPSRPNEGTVTYAPTLAEQGDALSEKFVVQYDIERSLDAGEIQV